VDPALQELIARLDLAPLPHEGGWFRQYYLSADRDAAGRPRASAIHFAVSPEGFSALHVLVTPETWVWKGGAPIELLLLPPGEPGRLVVVGPDAACGQVPAVTVPGGTWQGGRPLGSWAWADCRMEPAWDEREFTLGDRAALTAQWPAWAGAIARLTR